MSERVGRKPIGKRAMTAAERQQRRRARIRASSERAANAGKKAAARDRAHAAYVPAPPGVTHWRKVSVQTPEGEQTIFSPKTKPLAAVEDDLSDADVIALIGQLQAIATKRGLG